jgi:hypothetical protein
LEEDIGQILVFALYGSEIYPASLDPYPVKINTLQIPIQAPTRAMSEGKGAAIATPMPFHGERSKTDCFIHEVKIYMKGKPASFRDRSNIQEESKIMFALSYMKGGTAASWAERYMKRPAFDPLAKPGQEKGTYQHTTYNDFVAELASAFKEHNKGETA